MSTNADELRERVEQFERVLAAALRQKYAPYPPEGSEHIVGMSPVTRRDLLAFFDTYRKCGVYPLDWLERLACHLFDIKVQLYYILEVDLGLYNLLVHSRGYDEASSSETPHTLLTRLSLDQSLIGKSRVERPE